MSNRKPTSIKVMIKLSSLTMFKQTVLEVHTFYHIIQVNDHAYFDPVIIFYSLMMTMFEINHIDVICNKSL